MRAHIYLCILVYFLKQLLKLRMDRGGLEMSVMEALMRLRRVRPVTIASGGMVLAKRLTTLDRRQEGSLGLCGVVPTMTG